MSRQVITLTPQMSLIEAIRVMLGKRIAGAPVVDAEGRLVGILSEFDCLRVLAPGEYSSEDYEEEAAVERLMTREVETIPPSLDIYSIAHRFIDHNVRRLPVIENDRVVGVVSRRDVLKGIERMRAERINPPPDKLVRSQPGLYLSATDSNPGIFARKPK